MRSLRILGLLFFVSSSPYGPSAQTPPTTPTPTHAPDDETDKRNAAVGGKVIRLDTGDPLKKVRVELQTHAVPGFGVFLLTDELGQFLLENIPPGSYDLRVSRNGYVDAEYGQKKPGGSGSILTLTAGQHISDLLFKMVHTAAISGHVFDEDREPITGAKVTAYRASKRPGKEQRNGDEPNLTNDLGEFRIFDLTPGRYYLSVSYRHEPPFGRAVPTVSQGGSFGYLSSFYPNTVDRAKAQTISVAPGDEIRPVDFFLRTARFFTVRGRVICAFPGGAAVSGSVSVRPQGSGLAQAMPGQFANFQAKDGSFELRDVAPATYGLTASYLNRNGHEWHISTRPLEVINADVDNVLITISAGVDIPGRVTWEGPPAGDPSNALVFLRPVGEAQPFMSEPAVTSDRTFLLRNMPEGSYRPVVYWNSSKEDFFLKSVRYNLTLLTASP